MPIFWAHLFSLSPSPFFPLFLSLSLSFCVSFSSCFEMHTVWLTNGESQCGMINQPNSATLPRTHLSFQPLSLLPSLQVSLCSPLCSRVHLHQSPAYAWRRASFSKEPADTYCNLAFSLTPECTHGSRLECVHGDTWMHRWLTERLLCYSAEAWFIHPRNYNRLYSNQRPDILFKKKKKEGSRRKGWRECRKEWMWTRNILRKCCSDFSEILTTQV